MSRANLPGRRRFMVWLVRGFGSLWALGAAWVAAAFVQPPKSGRGLAEAALDAGPADALAVGQGRLVRHGRQPVWVVRTGDETYVGMSAVCTHLHCVLDWDTQRRVLDCPCHAGSFDLNGNVLSGPAPLPLERYAVESRMGRLVVNLNRA
ncbi:MAG: ubiquinol-cytochrome c reductase iron-sulfur subunit [Thermoanaerobaculia bacterium]